MLLYFRYIVISSLLHICFLCCFQHLKLSFREKHDNRTTSERLSDYFVNDGPKLVFIILWILGNAVAFGIKFYGSFRLLVAQC
jgi:hypothetical protein